jgi:thioesterase superfamily protein 4
MSIPLPKDDASVKYFIDNHTSTFSPLFTSPDWTYVPTRSRKLKSSGEDELFAVTLNTPLTMPYCLTLGKLIDHSDPNSLFSEVRTYMKLEHGINGYPDVCHGGIVATLLDEVMGIAMGAFRQRGREVEKRLGTYVRQKRNPGMTAELVTTYVRPVRTPAVVCIIVGVPRVDGRKTWVEAEILSENGEVLSKGKALFVQLKTSHI